MCLSMLEKNVLQQVTQTGDESCKRDLAMWMEIASIKLMQLLLRMKFTMSGDAEKLQMKLIIGVWTQKWVLLEEINNKRREW